MKHELHIISEEVTETPAGLACDRTSFEMKGTAAWAGAMIVQLMDDHPEIGIVVSILMAKKVAARMAQGGLPNIPNPADGQTH